VIAAHGSPRAESNADLECLADAVRGRCAFAEVRLAYLECNAPDIATAVDACAAAGAERIVVVPWFLHTGNHVARDIPDILAGALRRHPGVEILMAPFAGSSPRVTGVIAARARAACRSRQRII
jgi:sirohydrochlorin ferrochelatase